MAGVFVVVVAIVAWVVAPILTSTPQGESGQPLVVEGFPTSVTALGADGRKRELSAELEGTSTSLDALVAGDRITVRGSGYDSSTGVYVAICKIPDSLGVKPGPCLGGVGSMEEVGEAVPGAIEYGASNWVNDVWAWRLFGARSFDDAAQGTFTAFIEVPEPAEEGVDCRADPCGLYTRNDHTALADRVQDLYIPIAFGG